MPNEVGEPRLNIEVLDDLLAWLHETGRIEPEVDPTMRPLEGGVSSRVVLVSSPHAQWVLKQALWKLRVPVDWYSDTSRVHREASALRWLEHLAPVGASPRFVFEDKSTRVVCMAAVPEPHMNWKQVLLAGDVRTEHIDGFAEIIGTIHVRSGRRLSELEPEFGDCSFFESLRLEPYYQFTAGQVPAAAYFLETLQRDTRAVHVALVHGDLSPKNILIREGTLVLVDHEVAHIGDPAFDLGFSTTHLLSKARHVASARASFLDAARRYWSRYAAITAREPWSENLEERVVRHTLACLLARVAGRSQLEYFDADEKSRQTAAVLALIEEPPATVDRLVSEWNATL